MRTVRALDTAAILVTAALFAAASHHRPLALIPVGLSLLALLPTQGLQIDLFGQLAASMVTGALPAYLALNVLDQSPPHGILEPIPGAAAMAMLGATAIRPLFPPSRPAGLANSGLLILSLISLGQARIGPAYIFYCALAGAFSLLARRIEQRPHNAPSHPTAYEVLTVLLSLALATGGTALGGWALPFAHRWALQRMLNRYNYGRTVTGLGDRMGLEALDGMLQSDTIVLRVRGGQTDYLRGVVFDRYRVGAWSYSTPDERSALRFEQRAWGMQPGEIEIRRLSGPHGWVLLPLNAGSIAVPESNLEVLPSGVVRSAASGEVVWFHPGTPSQITLAPPRPMDSELSRSLRSHLEPIVQTWNCNQGTPEVRVRCIEQRLLRDYHYSLQVPGNQRMEPILAFLLRHKRGHCEYFASALALLSRAAGVPSRVVAGYRVHERSEWGDYYVVRERNAHSWTEVFLPERGWTRFDPTPPSGEEITIGTRLPRWRTFLESLRWSVTDVIDRVRAGNTLSIAAGLLTLGLLLSIARRNLREYWKQKNQQSTDGPTQGMQALLDALERFALRRERAETIERFASRITQSTLPKETALEVSNALLEYTRARYGNEDLSKANDSLVVLAAKLLTQPQKVQATEKAP